MLKFWMHGLVWALAMLAPPAVHAQEGRGDVVYVPTPQIVVNEMLEMAKMGPNDYLIDLGSGDGRFVITAVKRYKAQGFGVDLDTYLLGVARKAAAAEGVADRAQFIEQNLFETPLDKATVISTYLLPEMNLRLRPKILAMKPGTRVVAHDYHMGDWNPDDQKTLSVPEKKVGNPGVSYVYLWHVPAKAAGRWQSQINVGGKDQPYEFAFEQLFQVIDGSMRVAGQNSGTFTTKLRGEQLTFIVPPAAGRQRHEFSGRIVGDTITGTVKIGDGAAQRQSPWVAKIIARSDVRRPADDWKGEN